MSQRGKGVKRPLKWAAALGEELVSGVDRRAEERKKKAKVYRCYEYSSLESYKQNTNSGRLRLESFERAFRYLFEHTETRLGHLQKRLIDVITIAILGKIFGDDLVNNLRFLRQKYLIDELNDTVAILFPRRSGKTEGSAIIIAVIAVSQPNGNCIMYNLTATQAKEFLQSVLKHLMVRSPVRPFATGPLREGGSLAFFPL
jgi:uncharacterized Rmd1/YagE family protein